MNTNHSPLPFAVRPTGIRFSSAQINDAEGKPVAYEAKEANADYIVRACNAFPALVEALQRAVNHLIMDINRDGKGIHSYDTPEALTQARAALALARGEKGESK